MVSAGQRVRLSHVGWRGLSVAAAMALMVLMPGYAFADETPVRGAHEDMDPKERIDDLGIFVPVSVSYPARRYPATMEFPTGPEVGERLPDFTLPNQHGEPVDFHQDRGDAKAVVVFYRSAVW